MNAFLMDRQPRHLLAREALSTSDGQTLWQLASGALRIDSSATLDAPRAFVRLALPGDFLGVESLVGMTDPLWVRALTPARLVPVVVLDQSQLTQLLMDAVLKGHQRCREVVNLRTGSALERVKRLLLMLAGDGNKDSAGAACEATVCALPNLNDMAAIVNAAPETVCRVLASLRELNFLEDCSPPSARNYHLELREHRLRPGKSLSSTTLSS